MLRIHSLVSKALSIGLRRDLSEVKKLAIQIATLDAYWTLIVVIFYIFHALNYQEMFSLKLHLTSLIVVAFGLYLLSKQKYDWGRVLIHLTGLVEIFIATDRLSRDAGVEIYFFTSIAIPFVTFSFEEQWKGNVLTLLASLALLVQAFWGPGIFFDVMPAPSEEKIYAYGFVLSYFILIFTVARWQFRVAQKQINRQQEEIIHSANLMALGEMAAGMAHEINNPLTTLSLQLEVLKDKVSQAGVGKHLDKMDDIIQRMGKMVQGLKYLSRKENSEPLEVFTLAQVMDSVMSISQDKLRKEEICFKVSGETGFKLKGSQVQLAQVFINLLNNSVAAIRDRKDKWIQVEVKPTQNSIQVMVTDSGAGIAPQVAEQMMKPFYTTKERSVGTGLGLSISTSIVNKHGGVLYYDPSYMNTRFIIELPLAILAEVQ